MWIKSLYNDTWVSMKHVTHFRIVQGMSHLYPNLCVAYAYLDTGSFRSSDFSPDTWHSDQARVPVCQGSMEECERFIVEQQQLESAFQWIGYLVAGGVGAVLTYFLT